jgi:hypothetical protein
MLTIIPNYMFFNCRFGSRIGEQNGGRRIRSGDRELQLWQSEFREYLIETMQPRITSTSACRYGLYGAMVRHQLPLPETITKSNSEDPRGSAAPWLLGPHPLVTSKVGKFFGLGMHKKSMEAAAHLERVGDEEEEEMLEDDGQEKEQHQQKRSRRDNTSSVKRAAEGTRAGPLDEFSEDEKAQKVAVMTTTTAMQQQPSMIGGFGHFLGMIDRL